MGVEAEREMGAWNEPKSVSIFKLLLSSCAGLGRGPAGAGGVGRLTWAAGPQLVIERGRVHGG